MTTQTHTELSKNEAAQAMSNAVPGTIAAVLAASEDFELSSEGPACYLRPGDAGFEECEACQ